MPRLSKYYTERGNRRIEPLTVTVLNTVNKLIEKLSFFMK